MADGGYRNDAGAFLYAVKMTGSPYVKFGVSRDVNKRLGQLQTGNPESLVVLATHWFDSEVDAYDIETGIHGHLSDCRACGEWFSYGERAERVISLFGDEAIKTLSPLHIDWANKAELHESVPDNFPQALNVIRELQDRLASVEKERDDALAMQEAMQASITALAMFHRDVNTYFRTLANRTSLIVKKSHRLGIDIGGLDLFEGVDEPV